MTILLLVAAINAYAEQNESSDETFVEDAPPVEPIQRFTDPPKLRPCCMFGHDLRVKIDTSMVPAKIRNVLDPQRLGKHSYEDQTIDQEMNGLIYTCLGGTIDIAHVRDYADWTAFLYVRIRKMIGSSGLIPLPPEGADRDILIRSFNANLSESEKNELAILLAHRISFELSVWHEIITWYGHTSVDLFSERASSFSPEDMYSNLLGCKIGANALRNGMEFNEAVDAELELEIFKLDPLLPGQTRQSLNAVDGLWWDSTRQMPDFRLVIRRNLDVSDEIKPWRVSDHYSPFCSHRNDPPTTLKVPTKGPKGLKLKDLYELRFIVDRTEVPRFHMPDTEKGYVNEDDFPYIISRIRREVKEEFGPFGDQSGMDVEELGVVPKVPRLYDPKYPCGKNDPNCDLARKEQTFGVKVGKIRIGGGNHPGPLVGATLAEVITPGGGFSALSVNSAVNYDEGGYVLHVRPASTEGALLFCSEMAEDGSGKSDIDWPFVNPFNPKCLPGAVVGIDMDLLEVVTEEKLETISIRPVEFGLVFNALANGYTPDYLKRHLLFSIGVAPEWIRNEDYNESALRMYGRMLWNNYYDSCRWKLSIFSQFRDDISDYEDYMGEAGSRITYNILWPHPDYRNNETIYTTFALTLEGGLEYWSHPENSMPGMLQFYIPPSKEYSIIEQTDGKLSGRIMLYLEMTIPTLGLF